MYAPGLAPFVAKCYGEKPANVFYETDSSKRKDIYQAPVCSRATTSVLCMPVENRLAKGGDAI